ncbi:Cu(I)-responsive transcriptional regulator [Agaricicola taiwanensis]|uniref:Cu(I)-responsive transcriptional regulator n=1 Tax=Agaricicola taiwanensis TaxID=591372 RepID=A0A8J2YH95_9RHOB|nr:Cu(I)-responsive transcriptional regulator [Agaricicola taiwanensis]GGE42037.1 Cu(I)-responsive transcriptional regulator [Agaricicola taiwanensis]
MNVAEAAKSAGLTPKAVRFYESEGLVRPPRAANGYRVYDEGDINRLRFLSRARSLGFSLEECRKLLDLYDDKERSSDEVRTLTEIRMEEIDRRIHELREIRKALMRLASCQGDDRPDCPILDEAASPIAAKA